MTLKPTVDLSSSPREEERHIGHIVSVVVQDEQQFVAARRGVATYTEHRQRRLRTASFARPLTAGKSGAHFCREV
jgi:hypothetical protein